MKDTHTVLTELKEKMKIELDPCACRYQGDIKCHHEDCTKCTGERYNAITRCIALVEEKLKANSK